MLNGDHSTLQLLPGIGAFLDSQCAVGVIKKCHLGYFIVDHGDILGGLLADNIMGCRIPFNYGIISTLLKRDLDAAVPVRHKDADGVAVRADNLKTAPADGNFCPSLILEDAQSSLGRLLIGICVIAVSGNPHRCGRVRVNDIILQISINILFLANCVKNGILINIGAEGELHAPGLSLYAFHGIQDFEFAGVAVPGCFCGDRGNIPVIHVHDPGSLRDHGWIGKGDIDLIIAYPGLRPEGKDLLLVLLAINGDLVGHIPVRGTGHLGGENLIPSCASGIDVLGGGEHLLGALQFHSGQIGIDLEVVNVPVTQKITPERHFSGIITLVLVFQAQFLQTAGRIAAGDNANDLGIA